VLSGVEFSAVRDAIAGAFNPEEFDMFLRERLDVDRRLRVADGAFVVVVTNVLKTAEQEGWEAFLIAEVAAARPHRPDIQQIYEKYAAALVDESCNQTIVPGRLDALERFGLAPRVTVQDAGVPQPPAATSLGDEGLERVVRPHVGYVDFETLREQSLRIEGQVCRVELNGQGIGTGFLVGPDALLTNYHVLKPVIEGTTPPTAVKFRFDFRLLRTGLRSEGTLATLHGTDWLIDVSKPTAGEIANNPAAALPSDDELDYALVRLDSHIGDSALRPGVAGSSARGWIQVPGTAPALGVGTPILIVQHPKGNPVALAIDTSGVQSLNANGTRVRYNTNTESGSSGSPCFDLNWTLVALHHYGDPLHDQAQYNQGIPIAAIRARIDRQGKSAVLGGTPPFLREVLEGIPADTLPQFPETAAAPSGDPSTQILPTHARTAVWAAASIIMAIGLEWLNRDSLHLLRLYPKMETAGVRWTILTALTAFTHVRSPSPRWYWGLCAFVAVMGMFFMVDSALDKSAIVEPQDIEWLLPFFYGASYGALAWTFTAAFAHRRSSSRRESEDRAEPR
jgi:Trypsin-like peptidase domain/Effector-associated domain 1